MRHQPNTHSKTGHWTEQAACATYPVKDGDDPWYPRPGRIEQEARKAFETCSECPVRQICLDKAIERRERDGIFGGMTPQERKRERQRRQRKERKGKDQ